MAEDLEPEHEQTIIDNIMRHTQKWLFFTAATPEQTGSVHHVNLREHGYWIEAFERRGLAYRKALTDELRAALEGAFEGSSGLLATS